MQHVYKATFSSLALIAGTFFWSSPGRTQDFCYLIDNEGRTIDLEHLCDGNDGTATQPGAQAVEAPAEATADESTPPRVRSFTIIGPVVDPDAPAPEPTELAPPGEDASPSQEAEPSQDSSPADSSPESTPAEDASPSQEAEPSQDISPADNSPESIPADVF